MRNLITTLLILISSPAFAITVHCTDPAQTVAVDVEFAFESGEEFGAISSVKASAGAIGISTAAGATTEYETVNFDRLQVGISSPDYGPLALRLDVVRTSDYDQYKDAEINVAVGGVVAMAGAGGVTLACTGW
jgi:hypothetical protein